MLNGLYASSAGARIQAERIDRLADNLAKMTSTGYKADYAAVQAAAISKGGIARPGRLATAPDFSEGTPVASGSPMDIAIIGEGFLVVSDGRNTYYTRNGSMHVDTDGELAVAGGFKVLGEDGPISVARDARIEISSEGNVMQEGASRGRLRLASFADPVQSLRRSGDNFVTRDPGIRPGTATAQVSQGMREGSNVSSIRSMVTLIESSRAFEANMRIIGYQDSALGKLISQVGSVPM